MIIEIDVKEYQQNDMFPNKIKKEIEKYSNIGIFNEGNSWEVYQYFLANENKVRRIIKRGKDMCMITTFDENNQSHIDVIQYGKDGEIVGLTKIDSREDGFDYFHQRKSNSNAITMYEKHGDSAVETRFTPSATTLIDPIIEVDDKPYHTISYLFSNGIDSPSEISLSTLSSYTNYKKRDNGLYSLSDAGIIRSLRDILSGSKSITLKEVEKRLNSTHPFTDKLSAILQKAINGNYYGLKIPEELQEILNEISIKDKANNKDNHVSISTPVQDKIIEDNQEQVL